ncbi:MAG TPA: hypothetical protein VMZ29_09490 [Candidatus Bathyarchaeia archaeon]|nr:hypothetical protein [Candidatus Bathyarchaeia archaeon]
MNSENLSLNEIEKLSPEEQLELFASNYKNSQLLLAFSDPIAHLKYLIDEFPIGNQETLSGLIYEIGKKVVNVGIEETKDKTIFHIAKDANLPLGSQILELALTLEIYPNELISFLTQIYMEQGEWEKIINISIKAIESTEMEDARAMFVTGLIFAAFKKERIDIIESYLDDFLRNPELLANPYSLSNIIYALNRKEKCEVAIKLTKAYWAKPEKEMLESLYVNLSDTFIVANQMDPVFEEIIDESLEIFRDNNSYFGPVMFENIACFYAMYGLLDETLRFLKEAKKRKHPGFKYLKDLACFTPFKKNEKFLELFK